MSPELHYEQEYSKKTDIWSLGIILFEMCTFDTPFKSSTPTVLGKKVKKLTTPSLPDMYSN